MRETTIGQVGGLESHIDLHALPLGAAAELPLVRSTSEAVLSFPSYWEFRQKSRSGKEET